MTAVLVQKEKPFQAPIERVSVNMQARSSSEVRAAWRAEDLAPGKMKSLGSFCIELFCLSFSLIMNFHPHDGRCRMNEGFITDSCNVYEPCMLTRRSCPRRILLQDTSTGG